MFELIEFPSLPSGEPQRAVMSLIVASRDMPQAGEQFRFFRKRLKEYRLWDEERLDGLLAFLGLERGATMKPSPLVRELAANRNDGKARDILTRRLWEANPLLFKTVIELLKERVHSRDDLVKHIDSFAYRGKKLVRPQIEAWLHLALGLEVLRMVGIAFDLGPRGHTYLTQAGAFDVEEFLDEMASGAGGESNRASRPDESTSPAATADDASEVGEAGQEDADADEDADAGAELPADSEATSRVAARQPAAARQAAPAAARGPVATTPAESSVRRASLAITGDDTLSSPRGRNAMVSLDRFAGHDVFPADVLDETAGRIESWWAEQSVTPSGTTARDFGLTAESFLDSPEETVYRIAVAAALVFRLDGPSSPVADIYATLESTGVLTDLYYGTAPAILPDGVDSRALLLASLLARRCAATPDLAARLEQQDSGQAAFAVLEEALGQGLLGIELFWMMGALGELGALRHEDLPRFSALPRRLVRDTLFRLGFVASPYAHDAARLAPCAAAARRAAGKAGSPPDVVLLRFAVAAGCAYDCPNRHSCEYACRERAG